MNTPIYLEVKAAKWFPQASNRWCFSLFFPTKSLNVKASDPSGGRWPQHAAPSQRQSLAEARAPHGAGGGTRDARGKHRGVERGDG